MGRSLSDFSSSINAIYEKQWDFISNFKIQILHTKTGDNLIEPKDLNISISEINLPGYTCSPVEFFAGGEWRIANGRDEILTCSVTFRSYGDMENYKKLVKFYASTKEAYPMDNFCKISFFKLNEAPYTNESEIISFDRCLITGVSQVQFNHSTENQILEFSIDFKVISQITTL